MFTDEQQAIIQSSAPRMRVIAFSGTGKTSTLVGYARARQDRMLYLAYNKSIQLEASRKFPANVLCRTTHSLAFPTHGKKFAHKFGNVRPYDIAENLRLSFAHSAMVADTLNNYLSSADAAVGEQHLASAVRTTDGIEVGTVLDGTRKLWEQMQNTDSAVPMPHDGYLKLYSLSNPTLPADIVLFDEAQDANPVTTALVTAHKGKAVVVGDPYQSIYGWRGARDALARMENAETYALTHSFRFGQPIADIATKLLSYLGEKRRLIGAGRVQNPSMHVDQNKPHALIARTNMTIIEAAIATLPQKLRSYYVGGVESTKLSLIEDGYNLFRSNKEQIRDRFIRKFTSLTQLADYAKEASDVEMSILCRIVWQYAHEIPEIIRQIRALAIDSMEDAQRVFSTAHKSKGMEFQTVVLADDFADLVAGGKPIPITDIDRQEVHLHYVAATRAIEALRVSAQLHAFLAVRSA